MNIDVAALRGLVREKDVSFDTVVEAIESALLAAYIHTEGAAAHARAELDVVHDRAFRAPFAQQMCVLDALERCGVDVLDALRGDRDRALEQVVAGASSDEVLAGRQTQAAHCLALDRALLLPRDLR
jgi:hypothetical protein